MDWREAKKRLLQDKGRKEAYEKIDLEYEIGKMITDVRIFKNLTQQRLAKLVGTKQPSIARLEKGNTLPSLSFLQRIADALDTQLLPPRFECLEEQGRKETKNFAVEIYFHTAALNPVCSFEERYNPRQVQFRSQKNVLSKTGGHKYA